MNTQNAQPQRYPIEREARMVHSAPGMFCDAGVWYVTVSVWCPDRGEAVLRRFLYPVGFSDRAAAERFITRVLAAGTVDTRHWHAGQALSGKREYNRLRRWPLPAEGWCVEPGSLHLFGVPTKRA